MSQSNEYANFESAEPEVYQAMHPMRLQPNPEAYQLLGSLQPRQEASLIQSDCNIDGVQFSGQASTYDLGEGKIAQYMQVHRIEGQGSMINAGRFSKQVRIYDMLLMARQANADGTPRETSFWAISKNRVVATSTRDYEKDEVSLLQHELDDVADRLAAKALFNPEAPHEQQRNRVGRIIGNLLKRGRTDS